MKVFGININLPDLKFADPKEAKFIAMTGGIVLVALLIGVVPNIYQLFHVTSKITQMKSKSRIAEEKIKNLPQLRNKLKAYVSQIDELEEQFFDVDQVAELIGMISELAKESGVIILSSKQFEYKGNDVVAKNPFYKPILLKLELEGRYHNFGKFVNLLERHSKLILLSEMSIEQSEKKKDALAIELSILTFLKVGREVSS
ncbi:MAG: type 4a pilus biogenesis protein PilO [Candidatus Omnitrophica bacterium]|nr:type 4a pilus biogenesis protein PilO [Candidatus Omnitrophota bacterium]